MKKTIFAVLFVVACGGPNGTDPICDNDCGAHGVCNEDTLKCECEADYFGDKCELHFDPSSEGLVFKTHCASDTGRLEIKETEKVKAENATHLVGSWVDVPANAFDRCVYLVLGKARGTNLPAPKKGKVMAAKGLEVTAYDKEQPFDTSGNPSPLQPQKTLKILQLDRGEGVRHDVVSDKLIMLKSTLTPEGTVSETDHLSPFYVVVDLCENVNCEPWETCRDLDGQCVGSDPCEPNPCQNGFKCDNKTGKPVCSCSGKWSGQTCEVEDLCYQNTCNGNGTCQPSDGSCKCNDQYDPSTQCADCKTGYDKSSGCTTCASGYIDVDSGPAVVCQLDPCGSVTCVANASCNGGTCSCNGGFTDTGTATAMKCVSTTCVTSGNLECGGNGTCKADGTCNCTGNFDPNPTIDCTACKTGFAGANCDSCAPTYIGYPNCQKDPCSGVTCGTNEQCNGGTCDCLPNHTKVAGTCQPDTCVSGSTLCNNHGNCVSGSCSCTGGWSGTKCTTPPDPCAGVNCNGHGTCSGGTCNCTGGWTGTNCTIPPPPTVSSISMNCPGGWCTHGLTYNVTVQSSGADTIEVSLESQVGNPSPGSCNSASSPPACTPAAGGDEVKVKVRACNHGGTQCVIAYSIKYMVQ